MTAPVSNVPRVILLALAAAFVAFGVAFLLAPLGMAGHVEIPLGTPTARIEIRAFYGGLELGLGVFLAITALRDAWRVPGLLAALLALGGVAAARIYGITVEGTAGVLTYLLLAAELAGAGAAAWGLIASRKQETSGEPEPDPLALEDKPKLGKTAAIQRTLRLKTERIDPDDR